MNPLPPKHYVQAKINTDYNVANKTIYSGQPQHITFSQVVTNSSNNALFFYIAANVGTAYYLSTHFDSHDNQKYIYMGISLYLTQIIYNYLDVNSSSNLDRLVAVSP